MRKTCDAHRSEASKNFFDHSDPMVFTVRGIDLEVTIIIYRKLWLLNGSMHRK